MRRNTTSAWAFVRYQGAAAYRATLRHILSSICRSTPRLQQGNQQTSRDYHFVIPTHACVGSKEYSHGKWALQRRHGCRREPPGGPRRFSRSLITRLHCVKFLCIIGPVGVQWKRSRNDARCIGASLAPLVGLPALVVGRVLLLGKS